MEMRQFKGTKCARPLLVVGVVGSCCVSILINVKGFISVIDLEHYPNNASLLWALCLLRKVLLNEVERDLCNRYWRLFFFSFFELNEILVVMAAESFRPARPVALVIIAFYSSQRRDEKWRN